MVRCQYFVYRRRPFFACRRLHALNEEGLREACFIQLLRMLAASAPNAHAHHQFAGAAPPPARDAVERQSAQRDGAGVPE